MSVFAYICNVLGLGQLGHVFNIDDRRGRPTADTPPLFLPTYLSIIFIFTVNAVVFTYIKFMSKYSVMGYEPALVLVATLMAIMAVSVVAVPAAHHLHHHSGGHHRMTSSNGVAGSSSPSLSGIDHPLSKRSFFDIQCKGVYDKTIFARLDRVCEDCYNLFREPQLHSLCRKNCFTTDFFKGCLDVLLLEDEVEKIQNCTGLILSGLGLRSTCFNTVYFKACLESLQMLTEETQYNQMVEFLGKK
ncbi:crustacean hyperglycemic hormones A isoform X2 [Aphis craccivora]|uniref:Crustacean hyperglycemic hormones A isoform X2 n=1 Tax=Aphis craccivora TaxID=307492 RepID=A0A6G0Z006_APHCR|nr:crustacean hyperglycemic hormones A isoform X2 [Aphis craccivora]